LESYSKQVHSNVYILNSFRDSLKDATCLILTSNLKYILIGYKAGIIRVYPATSGNSHYLQIKVGSSPITSIKIIKGLLCEYCVVALKNEKFINIYRIDGLYQKNADDSIASPVKVMANINSIKNETNSVLLGSNKECIDLPITKMSQLYIQPWMKSSKEVINYYPLCGCQEPPDISYKIHYVIPSISGSFKAILCGDAIAYPIERILCIYNIASLSYIYLAGHASLITAIAYSSYNNHIATGGYAEILIWDSINHILLHKIELPNIKNQIKQLEFPTQIRCLVVLTVSPTFINIYDEFYGGILHTIDFHNALINGICANNEFCFVDGDNWVGCIRLDDKYTVYKQIPNDEGNIQAIAPMENGIVLGTKTGSLVRYNACEEAKHFSASFHAPIKSITYSSDKFMT
jgi:hypothetical protein